MRTPFAVLFSCVLLAIAAFSGPAEAGGYGYYGNGYYGGYGGGYYGVPYRPVYPGHVWYSSSCCYSRVVRHSSHYVYVNGNGYYGNGHGYYGGGYYGRGYYGGGYYGGGYRYGYGPRYYGRPYYGGYGVYAGCRRVFVANGYGGVVAVRAGC